MKANAALLLAVLLAGCSAAPPVPDARTAAHDRSRPSDLPCPGEGVGCGCVPDFRDDGSIRRDDGSRAPLYLARCREHAGRAPRFNADGTVARDLRTGAAVCVEQRGGVVSRVFLALP